jgi:hypothetical protein
VPHHSALGCRTTRSGPGCTPSRHLVRDPTARATSEHDRGENEHLYFMLGYVGVEPRVVESSATGALREERESNHVNRYVMAECSSVCGLRQGLLLVGLSVRVFKFSLWVMKGLLGCVVEVLWTCFRHPGYRGLRCRMPRSCRNCWEAAGFLHNHVLFVPRIKNLLLLHMHCYFQR